MIRVLIVDDEAPIREWVEYCILREKEKFSVAGLASSGEEALELIKKEMPEVVIADIRMPGMDGLELMKKAKEISPFTAFIVMTNYAEFSYAKQAITYGAKEYLLKSEMCAGDLIGALGKINENKEEIIKHKVRERLPSGFIDLFRLYQCQTPEAMNEFLDTIGIKGGEGGQVLCIRHGKGEAEAAGLIELAKEEGLGKIFLASRQEYDFMIAQDNRKQKLEEAMGRIGKRVAEKYGKKVGISAFFSDRMMLIHGLRQAVETENHLFFHEGKQVLHYCEKSGSPGLSREAVRAASQQILWNLAHKQYEEALSQMREWFDGIKNVQLPDSQWAIERCQRMVIAVEEQYYHRDPLGEGQAKNGQGLLTMEDCRRRCEELIQKLYDKKKGPYSESVDRALAYIHENYNRDISLVDVASHIYRSPEYFSRLFKDEVGENFSVYLMMCRLNHGRDLLINTDRKIADIAAAVGYSTQSYFSRLYKKYMGKTPDEERSQARQ